MRLALYLVLDFLLVALATACEPANVPSTDTDLVAVQAVDEAYVDAVRTQDWEGLVSVFTPDVVYMPPNTAPVVGRRANLTRFQSRDWSTVEYTHDIVDVGGAGDVAYTHGTYSVNITLGGSGAPVVDDGKYLAVLLKQADESWLIDKMIWSSSHPR